MKMPGANSTAALALAAALAVFAACKAVDQAEHRGRGVKNAPADKAAARPAGDAAHAANDGHDHGPQGNVRRISIEEAQAAAARGEVVYVDVRGEDAYRVSHIAGSVLMPNSEIARRGSELPKDKLIIFYCA